MSEDASSNGRSPFFPINSLKPKPGSVEIELDFFSGVCEGVHRLSLEENERMCIFNLYAEYIMQNTGLDEAQAGIKIAGRNINNLRYADDTTLIA